MFKVKTGTKVIAVPKSSFAVNGFLKTEVKTTKKEANYFLEDIGIDPIKPGPCIKTIGWDYATRGYYGFKLNGNEWDMMLVHSNDVEVF